MSRSTAQTYCKRKHGHIVGAQCASRIGTIHNLTDQKQPQPAQSPSSQPLHNNVWRLIVQPVNDHLKFWAHLAGLVFLNQKHHGHAQAFGEALQRGERWDALPALDAAHGIDGDSGALAELLLR